MRLRYFKEITNNLRGENRLLKFTVLAIGICSVFSAFMSYQAVKHQKVVILPATGDARIVIHGNEVNNEYLKLFSKYVLNLLFSYTPYNFQDQSNDLLKICSPSFYPPMKSKLGRMESSVRKLNITSSYYPRTLTIDRAANEITVDGLRFQSAHGAQIEKTVKKYLLKYKIIDGRFYLDGIQEISNR